ncbi:DNA replication/repair protein RecF [Pelotomaculum isophthalicicum JI]|uniref:DNA replication and repair protein RecF n=1 Tax=Pelotomaculum isophthalicicum JI TaxID=947010 RepID=A0A9X4H112_9FIRM|nr:DNA replication/repair protein RecF [Pelotomaculum isophthalicicum]MDF9407746.1 DNA replication/repair protein RecF [Pelotomaculum isophthalicicum JI]
MRLQRLELTNFRNYLHGNIEPGFSLNVLNGDNAQGKTNILESIYLACTGKSFRTIKESEIINWQCDFSLISCLFESAGRELDLKILLTPGQKKIKVNGALARGYPLGWPGVVLFTPDDLVIVKGSPQERRRFLDLEIGPLNHQYGHYLIRYQRVLTQRNNLLREIRDKKCDSESLQTWNEQFCQYGSKIIFLRIALLKKVNPVIKNIYRELTGGVEEIGIRYLSSLRIDNITSEQEIINHFNVELSAVKNEEIARGQSLIGPHRDDLVFLINKKEAKVYGSQGQQRTIVLVLKLAQIQMWNNEIGEYPILLLDDVLFELDHARQNALFCKIKDNVQTFITSNIVKDIGTGHNLNKKLFIVREGKIIN